MPTSPRDIATTYFEAWQAADADRLRSITADHATFVGPMGTADGAQEFVDGLLGMREHVMNGLTIALMLSDGTDVMTWYDLHTDAGDLPTVNWTHVEDGLITAVRATFDPRPVLPPS